MNTNFETMLKQCEQQAEKTLEATRIDDMMEYSSIFNNYFTQLQQIIEKSDDIDHAKLDNLKTLIEKLAEKLNAHKKEVSTAIANLGKSKVTKAYKPSRYTAARKFDSRT